MLRLLAAFAALALVATGNAQAADPPSPVETKTVTEVRIVGVRGTPSDSLEQVGFSSYSFGEVDDAAEAFREAIDASARPSGARAKTSLAQLHSNLAWIYQEMGRSGDADSLMRRAIVLDSAATGGDPLVIARRMTELAMLHQQSGRYAAAAPVLDEVLEIQASRAKKADAREVAFTLHLLARNYQAAGDPDKSLSHYRQALERLRETEAMDQRQWAAIWLDLAELYHATHRDKEALEAFEKAIKKANELYTAGGLSNAVVLNPYAVLQRRAAAVQATSDSSAR